MNYKKSERIYRVWDIMIRYPDKFYLSDWWRMTIQIEIPNMKISSKETSKLLLTLYKLKKLDRTGEQNRFLYKVKK